MARSTHNLGVPYNGLFRKGQPIVVIPSSRSGLRIEQVKTKAAYGREFASIRGLG
jgi:hypothetical protein